MSDTDQPSIAKQILGAGIGMIAALVLYQGYEIASPTLEAAIAPYLMTEPHLSAGTQDAGPLNSDKAMQIAGRARDIAARRAGARAGAAR
ncbi:hypothetical protein HZA45_03425 [Candidatus Peregrinibacteria bacterium]|nr:hypothetical protein [Candidatus Peregrinibacteria bacterium]